MAINKDISLITLSHILTYSLRYLQDPYSLIAKIALRSNLKSSVCLVCVRFKKYLFLMINGNHVMRMLLSVKFTAVMGISGLLISKYYLLIYNDRIFKSFPLLKFMFELVFYTSSK